MTIFSVLETMLMSFFQSLGMYLPNLIGGLIILIIGIFLSKIVQRLVMTMLRFFKVGDVLRSTNVAKDTDVKIWSDILSQVIGWAVVILFLIPASEIWGLTKISDVLRQLLFYIPSVIVAVIIAFIGLMLANLAANVVKHGIKAVDKKSASTVAELARYSILFFTVLIVLDQLGVARDLIRILFTGIVVMLSLAGGLAFGLGGKDLAKEILEQLRKRI